MRIAVVTEVSTKDRNRCILEALEGFGNEVINAGMSGKTEEPELTYIQTGLLSALILESRAAELVIGGCGTGQGYLNAVLQYPGIVCGLIESPLDAWLFRQINGGNCLSLALNKGFGWAGEENLRFIFERFFSAPSGCGYPEHRRESQRHSREVLAGISRNTHLPMTKLLPDLPGKVLLPVLQFPGVIDLLKTYGKNEELVKMCEEFALQKR